MLEGPAMVLKRAQGSAYPSWKLLSIANTGLRKHRSNGLFVGNLPIATNKFSAIGGRTTNSRF